ncbi:MAG: hypothetical protein H6719_35480 [Sandaracinaceae bacterium]|nr:hypothetical protein [Sandaracinaceae bacterium]
MSDNRRWLALAVFVMLVLGGLIAYLSHHPSRAPVPRGSSRGFEDPELGNAGYDSDDVRDAGVLDLGVASRGRSDDPGGQDESVEGRSDGAVPFVAEAPYQSPTDDVQVLSPAELRSRRLEQVALIEQSIADIDRQIALAPGTPNRVMLLGRREHLEARRAELLSVVLQER